MRKGSHLTPEQKAVQRAAHLGQKWNGSAAGLDWTGRHHTAESRAKISAAKKGVSVRMPPRTPEHSAAISRAKKGNTVISPEQREKLRIALLGNTNARDATIKGECVYCFAPAQTYDHVTPRGRPGWDDPDNLVPACYWCNISKKARTPEEWMASW